MAVRRLVATGLVLAGLLAAPRPAAAEWWEFIQEMSGPGPFKHGVTSDNRPHFLVRLAIGERGVLLNREARWGTFGFPLARATAGNESADLHFRFDLAPRTGDRADDGTEVDWQGWEFTLERTVVSSLVSDGVRRFRVFGGAGFSYNRFRGDAFEDFDAIGLNLTVGAVYRTGRLSLFGDRAGIGVEGGGKGVYLSVDPSDFELPPDAFRGGGELLLGSYLTGFFEIFF